MSEPPSSRDTTSPWSVSGDEAAQLMRLHREQLLVFEEVPTQPHEGAKAATRESRELSIGDVDADVRALVARYEGSHPGVRITPLRYITIGGREQATVVGTEELADEGLVSFVVTETILDDGLAEVTSRMLVAKTTAPDRSS